MFKLYSAKLRIGGSVLNEIRKQDLTAPEIEVLRAIHGSDAVLDIVETGSEKRADRAERARLEGIYANPAASVGDTLAKKRRMLSDLFGHERNDLPKEIEAQAEPVEDEDDDVDVVDPTIKRTVVEEPSFAE